MPDQQLAVLEPSEARTHSLDTSNTISERLLNIIPNEGIIVRDVVKTLITAIKENPSDITQGFSKLLGLNEMNPTFATDNIAQLQIPKLLVLAHANKETVDAAFKDGKIQDPEALKILSDLGHAHFSDVDPSEEGLAVMSLVAAKAGITDSEVISGLAKFETGLAPLAPYINNPGKIFETMEFLGLGDEVKELQELVHAQDQLPLEQPAATPVVKSPGLAPGN